MRASPRLDASTVAINRFQPSLQSRFIGSEHSRRGAVGHRVLLQVPPRHHRMLWDIGLLPLPPTALRAHMPYRGAPWLRRSRRAVLLPAPDRYGVWLDAVAGEARVTSPRYPAKARFHRASAFGIPLPSGRDADPILRFGVRLELIGK